jgi:hypothetical protein
MQNNICILQFIVDVTYIELTWKQMLTISEKCTFIRTVIGQVCK